MAVEPTEVVETINTFEIIYRSTEIGGFMIAIVTMIIGFMKISYKMGGMAERFEAIGLQQAGEIKELKDNVKGLSTVVVSLAELGGRFSRIEDRQLSEGKRLDGLSNELEGIQRGFREFLLRRVPQGAGESSI